MNQDGSVGNTEVCQARVIRAQVVSVESDAGCQPIDCEFEPKLGKFYSRRLTKCNGTIFIRLSQMVYMSLWKKPNQLLFLVLVLSIQTNKWIGEMVAIISVENYWKRS